MKKTYITPSVITIYSDLDQSFCKASIQNGSTPGEDYTPGYNIPDQRDDFEVGAKGSSSSVWDDDDDED